jgi:hypothetical protein
MPNMNQTTNERPEAKQIRAEMDAEQSRRREMEAAIARKHRPPGGGPKASASTEPQPGHRRPVIRPGG